MLLHQIYPVWQSAMFWFFTLPLAIAMAFDLLLVFESTKKGSKPKVVHPHHHH
ncbi:MAG TPA: hypothetical protein VG603_10180 [Chitinophagales bacterium]|nr:hypothetical protein [Chitinophagales bacterium]